MIFTKNMEKSQELLDLDWLKTAKYRCIKYFCAVFAPILVIRVDCTKAMLESNRHNWT